MSSTDKVIMPQTAAEWARLINEGPFDTTDGDREWQCRGCKDPISVDHGCEPTALCGMCSVEAAIVLAAAINPVTHLRVQEALTAAEKAHEDVRQVLRGHGHERMAPLAREVQSRIAQLSEANDGWFKKAGRAEERANRARVVRDEALAAVADKAWPFLRDHILGADGAKNLHEAADRALRGVRISNRSEVLKRMVVFVAACRTGDEKARVALLDKARDLIEEGREHAERTANAVAEWETTEPGSDVRAGAKLSNAASDAVEHIRDLAAALEVAATQAQLREKAVEIAVEGFRVQLASMQERLTSWRLVFEQGAEAYSRGVRFLDCPYPDERSVPWLRGWESARDVATIEAVERERDAASARAEETRRGLEELLAKVEADGAQEQAERAAIREAFEGLRARLNVAEARPSVETCKAERAAGNGGCGACALCCREAIERAETAEAGLAEVRRVVEEHDGEDPIPMVLPTIADEVRARLAAADRKAREAERERDAANAKT